MKEFRDIHTKENYKVGTEIDVTVKRATEIEKNLSKYGGNFIDRIEEEVKDSQVDEDIKEDNKVSKKSKK